MQSSLGIYIEKNIIKYAKLQKDKDDIKVEAYNVAFYDNDLQNTINKIISETYSYKVPISINVSNEEYANFEVSTLLSKGDMKKAIDIEYEMLCNERGINRGNAEHKYVVIDTKENPEKNKVLNVIASKSDILNRKKMFDGKKISAITPISTGIVNLVEIDGRENFMIVNIEENTQITTVVDGQLYQIDTIPHGMSEILESIARIENSYSKSYEVCKNLSVYTQSAAELYSESNEYMDLATSTLTFIATETKKILGNIFANIDKIYVTGSGTCINNVDLFLQDYITGAKCEILKPYFVNTSSVQIPIKEYIEVNSAISLALAGFGMMNKELDFSKSSGGNTTSILQQDINLDTIKQLFKNIINGDDQGFRGPLQSSEKLMIRAMCACVLTSVIFAGFSNSISKKLDDKTAKINELSSSAQVQLSKLTNDIDVISGRAETYKKLIAEITNEPQEDETGTTKTRIIQKDSIPNLLNRIMFVIPKKVKLTSIQNTSDEHIVIKAEAEKYEQLGYFKAVLTTNEILKNVKSTSGQKTGSVVEVTIEGDLP